MTDMFVTVSLRGRKDNTHPPTPSLVPYPPHTQRKRIFATFGFVLSPSPRYSGRRYEEVVSRADKAFIAVTFRKDKRQSVTMMRMPFANVAKRHRVSSDTASHSLSVSGGLCTCLCADSITPTFQLQLR